LCTDVSEMVLRVDRGSLSVLELRKPWPTVVQRGQKDFPLRI
jgi:hypothetical protein